MQTQNENQDERAVHEGFMREALKMAQHALSTDETPVGCVLVHANTIIARGQNATNATLNGTRHAEFVAVASLTAQGLDPGAVLRDAVLYVTVEPCIMCASLLRQYGLRKVYFGAVNERFGGVGGVLDVFGKGGREEGEEGEGDGGDGGGGAVVSGGWLREEAVELLRRFYVQENVKAPEPRSKKERKLKTEIESPVGDGGSDAG